MSYVVAQLSKRGRSFHALRRIFEKLKDASVMTGWEPETICLPSDNFPIRLLKSFHWPFTDGRGSQIKKYYLLNPAPVATGKLSVLFSELSLNYYSFLLTITKKETEQETNHSSSIESPRFLPFSFEELQKRSLLRRNSTDFTLNGLCDPLAYEEGFLEGFLNFRGIKLSEAQGDFRKECLILVYASTLPTDTLLIIKFLIFLWVC